MNCVHTHAHHNTIIRKARSTKMMMLNSTQQQQHIMQSRTTFPTHRTIQTIPSRLACRRAVVFNPNHHQGLRRVAHPVHLQRWLPCKAIEEAAPLSSGSLPPGSVQLARGSPSPLGPSPLPGNVGVNFALAAPAAAWVTLCLFDENGSLIHEVCFGGVVKNLKMGLYTNVLLL